jgi:hypothetical protein
MRGQMGNKQDLQDFSRFKMKGSTMAEKTDECANPSCNCPAEMASNYCCEACEKEEHDPEIGCHCGHPECEAGSAMPIA